MMRTPTFLLAGLLAMTVFAAQPAQACSSNDIPGCIPDVCDGGVQNCVPDVCDGGVQNCVPDVDPCEGNINTCIEPVRDLADEVVDAVEEACGGSVSTCDDTARDLAAALADEALGLVDADRDNVPDAAESSICGRQALRDAINANQPLLGSCATALDYVPPSSTTYLAIILGVAGYVLDEANEAAGEAVETAEGLVTYATWLVGFALDKALDAAGDGDRDGVPDAQEPLVCSLEDSTTPLDGTCVGGDYSGVL